MLKMQRVLVKLQRVLAYQVPRIVKLQRVLQGPHGIFSDVGV